MFQFSVFFEDHGFETDEYCDEQGMLNVFANIKHHHIHSSTGVIYICNEITS